MDNPADQVGQLVMSFQQVENNLTVTLGLVLGDRDWRVPKIFSAKLPFRNLCDVIDALMRVRLPDSEFVDSFEKIMEQASKLEQHRNTFVHSFYDVTSINSIGVTYERSKSRIKRKKGFSTTYEQIDTCGQQIQDVIELAIEVDKAINQLNEDLILTTASEEEIERWMQSD